MHVIIMAYRNFRGAAAARGQERDAVVVQNRAAFYLSAALVIELAFLLGMLGTVTSAPAENLISTLPGQPQVKFKQYGGFITVDAQRGRALYYYFVEAEADAGKKPLTLWLNGGPGCSSLGGGAFSELGPFFINGISLSRNFNAWNRVSNVLFLESPAGVGFSYSNATSDYVTGDRKTALDSLTFLLEWFKKFPEYRGRDFFITGESYAGHYAPQLAAAVVENNAQPAQVQIELKGLLVGNPLFDLFIDTVYSPVTFLWSHGLISEATHDEIILLCRLDGSTESNACRAVIGRSLAEAGLAGPVNPYDVLADICTQLVTAAEARWLVKHVNQNLDINLDAPISPCIEEEESVYLNLPEVQNALHARRTNWSMCSRVLDYRSRDLQIPIVPVLKDLLQGGLRLWIFSGDQDSVIPLIGTRQLVDQVANELHLNSATPYRVWFEGQQVGGWTTSWGNFTYATVRGAGHMVPATQPSRALQLFTSFIHGTSLPSTP